MGTQLIRRTAVEIDGAGDAVVCLHGLGGTSNTWTPLMQAFSGLRAVRIDLPGSGRSPLGEAESSIAGYVDTVLAVLAQLDIRRAHFVGHSLGTIVCLHLAAAQPRLARSLALFGPLAAPAEAARAGILARARKAREGGMPAMQEIADAIVAGALSGETRRNRPEAVAMVRESLMRQDPEGYARSCEALAAAQPPALAEVSCPALLATGDEDGVAPPQSVRMLAERLPASRAPVVYARCGHWTPFERAADCLRELKSFYASALP